MILKGFLNLLSGPDGARSVTVSESDNDKVGLDVNVVAGGSTGGSIAVNWDYYDISYVTSGDGLGQIETIEYYSGTPGSGTLLQTNTYSYNSDDNIDRVEKDIV